MPVISLLVLPVLSTIFTLLIPVLAQVVAFTIPRLVKIPSYIRLLKILYSDMDSSVQERQYVTGGLLVLGSILTFIASSLVPWTGVPLIGAVTSSIAGAIAIVVALASLDIVFTINEGYYTQKLKGRGFSKIEDIELDINQLKNIFGNSWSQVISTVKDGIKKVQQEAKNQNVNVNFSDRTFPKDLDYQLEGLSIYVGKMSNQESQDICTEFFNQKNSENNWFKELSCFGTGASLGALAGLGTSAAASSIFVQASLWTTLQGLFGLSTGVVVSASTYTLLTLAAPVGLGVLATIGVYSGLKSASAKEEAAQRSKFLAEIIIGALPMAWVDGQFAVEEKDSIDRLMTVSGIRKEERDSIYQAMANCKTFDDIIQTSILFDEKHRQKNCSQSITEQVKHRLLLCVAWEIALADNCIQVSELRLHNRMAEKLGISLDEVKEIRRVLNLKHEQELLIVAEVLERDGSKTQVSRNVRQQYVALPECN